MAPPVLPEDPTYPLALLHLLTAGLPPCPILYTRGAWPPRPGIAIVGTRNPTEEALTFTRSLAAAITGAGWAVWSGGARGIDAAAHRAALDRGGTTVVVTPSGFGRPYPPEHEELFAQVVEAGGTLVSPFPETAPPRVPAFHRRNAVLAALTLATVVVQAGFKSGARSTARAARRLRRPLYVVPHAPWDPRGQGCALELEAGARALALVDTLVASLRSRPDAQLAIPFDATRDAGAHAPRDAHAPHGADAPRDADAHDRRRTRRVAAPSNRAMHAREHDHAQEHTHDRAHDHARVARTLEPTEQRVLDAIGETPIHTDDLCERAALPSGVVTAALLTLTLQAVVVEAPAGFYRRSTP